MTSSRTQLIPTVTQRPSPPPTQINGWWGRGIKIEQNRDKNCLLFWYSFIFIYLLSAHFKNLFLDTDWIPGTRREVFTFNFF